MHLSHTGTKFVRLFNDMRTSLKESGLNLVLYMSTYFLKKKAQMSTYIDTKKGDTVAMVPAVCNMSHFLDSTTVG